MATRHAISAYARQVALRPDFVRSAERVDLRGAAQLATSVLIIVSPSGDATRRPLGGQISASAERVCGGRQGRRPWMLALVDRSPSGDGDGPPAVPAVYRGTGGRPRPVLFTPDVDGEQFAIRRTGDGGTAYDWLSGLTRATDAARAGHRIGRKSTGTASAASLP